LLTLLIVRRDIGAIRSFLQTLAVDDGDDAAPMGDPAPPLEFLHGDRHAGPRGAEHHAEELLRQGDYMADAIIGHEKPARQPLLYLVLAVRQRGLRALRQEYVRVMQEKLVEGRAFFDSLPQMDGRQALAEARDLDVGLVRRT